MQRNVLTYIEANTRLYEGPVTLDPTVGTVIARCGTTPPKLVYRIVPDALDNTAAPRLKSPPADGLNVVTIFIDAVSRPQFHRRLPKASKTLEALATQPQGSSSLFEFWRYHTIGLNTAPNTRALWAGLSSKGDMYHTPTSAGPPLWEQFETAGYVAARVDPMCQDWTAYYNGDHLGNDTSMSNISPRISHEHIAWSCMPPYLPIGKHFAGNFAGSTSIKARCISDTHVGWHALDWSEDFIRTYQKEDTSRAVYLNAAFMEGHEGSGEVLATLDDRLASFLSPSSGPIDYSNTAVVIVSDHGALMGLNYAFLKNGKIEAANPFAAMILPDRFLDAGGSDRSRRRNLERSSARLMTAYDLYETMRGLMGERKAQVPDWASSEERRDFDRKGIDLLRAEVPDRSCVELGIPENACRCV